MVGQNLQKSNAAFQMAEIDPRREKGKGSMSSSATVPAQIPSLLLDHVHSCLFSAETASARSLQPPPHLPRHFFYSETVLTAVTQWLQRRGGIALYPLSLSFNETNVQMFYTKETSAFSNAHILVEI